MSSTSDIIPFGALPTARQARWQETEIYSIVHFSLSTFADKEWGYGEDSPSLFHPTAFDPDQWAQTAKESGIKGLILVCKHHDGFCLWPTQTTEYGVRNSPWKNGRGDIVGEVSAACRKHGLKFGVYLSPWDRNHAEYGRSAYVQTYHRQLQELLTGYGPIFEVWFDGANGGDGFYGGAKERRSIDPATYYQWDKIEAMVRELQPEACIFGMRDIRYVGNESGVANETCWATQTFFGHPFLQNCPFPPNTGDRQGEWMPAECDFPLREGWFFHDRDEIRQPATLFELYFSSVGRGGTMNIGLAPDTRGILHEDDVRSLKGWKALMDETFADNLLASHEAMVSASSVRGRDDRFSAARVMDGNAETYWACDDGTENSELVFTFREPVKFNVLSIREHIALGQRVDAFAVDMWSGDHWNEVGNATSIGNRRLLVLRNANASKFRIRFTRTAACPAIREVALFRAPLGLILEGKVTIARTKEGMVHIRSSNSGLTIRYTTDGTEPTESSPRYTGPFPFAQSGTVRAFGYIENEAEAHLPSVSASFGVDRSAWRVVSVTLDSPFDNGGTAGVAKLLDDDPSTYWHTYHKDKTLSAPPHEVVLDMGRSHSVAAFTFQPRLAEGSVQAIPDQFAFHLSQDGESWTLAAEGEFANIKASPGMRIVPLPRPMSGRYLRFVAKHVIDEGNYVAVAGLGVIEAE